MSNFNLPSVNFAITVTSWQIGVTLLSRSLRLLFLHFLLSFEPITWGVKQLSLALILFLSFSIIKRNFDAFEIRLLMLSFFVSVATKGKCASQQPVDSRASVWTKFSLRYIIRINSFFKLTECCAVSGMWKYTVEVILLTACKRQNERPRKMYTAHKAACIHVYLKSGERSLARSRSFSR